MERCGTLAPIRAPGVLMPTSLAQLFNITRLAPNRRILALHHVRERAQARQLDSVATACDAAIAHDEHALSLETTRQKERSGQTVDSTALDNRIDRAMRMIAHLLEDYTKDTVKEVAAKARELQSLLLPEGLQHHINLPYAAQHVANERVVTALEAPEHRDWVDAKGFRPLANRLRNLNASFGALLHTGEELAESASWEQIQTARRHGHELLLRVVATIVGQFPDDDGADARTELLQPVLEQVEAASGQKKRLAPDEDSFY